MGRVEHALNLLTCLILDIILMAADDGSSDHTA
jgi:hypothetical protein